MKANKKMLLVAGVLATIGSTVFANNVITGTNVTVDNSDYTIAVGKDIVIRNDPSATYNYGVMAKGWNLNIINSPDTTVLAKHTNVKNTTSSLISGSGHEVENVEHGVVLGENNVVKLPSKNTAIAIGQFIHTDAPNTIGIGYDNSITAQGATAIGSKTRARGELSTAIGGADTAGTYAVAIGNSAMGYGDKTMALGYFAVARGEHTVAIGNQVEGGAKNTVSIGTETVANNERSISIGSNARSFAEKSVTLGHDIFTSGTRAVHIGADNKLNPYAEDVLKDGVLIGSENRINANTRDRDLHAKNSVVIGHNNIIDESTDFIAIGGGTVQDSKRSIVMGNNAKVAADNSVALGYDSFAYDVESTESAVIGGTTYNFAGSVAHGTVGIGARAANGERTITGLAAGRINDESTDAVNGSQLHAVVQAVNSVKSTADMANYMASRQSKVIAGDNVTVNTTNNMTGGNNFTVSVNKDLTAMNSATFGDNDKRNVIDKGSVRVFDGSVNTGVTANGMTIENTDTLEQASYTGSGMQASDDNATVRFTTTNIDAGNQQIHGVKVGTADTDVVNVKQLKDFVSSNDKDTITTVIAGKNMTVTSNGHEYTVSLDQATAKKIDDTAKGVADNATAIKTNADNIAINTANIIKAKSTVSAGTGVTVTETANANGSTNYEVAIDKSTMGKINAVTDGINGLNGKVGENAKAIDGLKSDVAAAKTTVSAGNGVTVNETVNSNGSTNYLVAVDTKVTDQIKANKDGIDGLNAKVADNTNAIKANTDGINGLNGKVGENAKAIDGLNGKVSDNTKAIANNANGIKANADAIKANKDGIALNTAAINELADRVVNGTNALNNKINDVQKEGRRGVASASALAALHPLDYNPDHKLDVMAGVGHYRGNTAVALGAAYRPNENVMFTVGASINGKDSAINAGISYKVGTKDGVDYKYSKITMQRHIDELNTTVAAQNEKIEQLNNLVEKLLEEVHQSK